MPLNESPWIHNKSILTIVSPAIDLSCMIRQVAYKRTAASVDVGTQCNPTKTAPGVKTNNLTVTLLNSFDSADGAGDGVFNQLDALEDTEVIATVKPKDAAVDSTNPARVFSFTMPPVDLLDVQTLGDKGLLNIDINTGEPIKCTSDAEVTAAITALGG